MIFWQFISIYLSDIIAIIVSDCCCYKSIIFTGVYILTFCLLNNLSIYNLIPQQHFSLQMLVVPILALVFAEGVDINNSYNLQGFNSIVNSIIVESFASSVVEEILFRNLIPANFSNKTTGMIVSGLLFAVIHIKSFNMNINIIFRIFTVSMLFNFLMFQTKPNNILYHFMWNLITLSLFKTTDLQGTTITSIELSNSTLVILLLTLIYNLIK